MPGRNSGRLAIGAIAFAISVISAITIYSFWLSSSAIYALFLVFGTCCVCYAYCRVKDAGVLQPMFFVICCLLLGTLMKIIYIGFVDNVYVDYTLLLGRSYHELNGGILIISISMICVSFGYLLGGLAFKSKKRTRNKISNIKLTFLGSGTTAVCILLLLVSAVSLAVYLAINGFSPDQLSGKRFAGEGGVDPSARFLDVGYYLFKLVLISKAAFYIFLIRALLGNRSKSNMLLLFLAFLLLVAVSFYFSNRIVAVSIVADSLVLSGIFARKLNWKYVAVIVLFVFVVFIVASSERSEVAASKSILDHIFAGRYLLDVSKTAHFYNYFTAYENILIEQFREFRLSNFLYIYVNLGRVAGTSIFGMKAAGVPLGYVVELYALAGFFGVVLGMFLLGMVLREIAIRLSERETYDYKLLFAGLLSVRLTVFLFNGGLGSTVYQILLDAIPLLLIVFVARTFDKKYRRTLTIDR